MSDQTIIKAEAVLIRATESYLFKFKHPNGRVEMAYGMPYFVLNGTCQLECHYLHPGTNWTDFKRYLADGRLYIFNPDWLGQNLIIIDK